MYEYRNRNKRSRRYMHKGRLAREREREKHRNNNNSPTGKDLEHSFRVDVLLDALFTDARQIRHLEHLAR